jgi:hypothetical protein
MAIRQKKIFLFLFLLPFCSLINAQSGRFDSLITAGVSQIYNIKFADAESTFAEVRKDFPNHPAGYFFDAMIYWWKIMLDFDNEEYDEIFFEKLENVIDLCDEILDEDPENVDAIFFKGGSLGFRGRMEAVRENWFAAGLDGKDALPLVYRAYELDSLNTDVQLGFGIYNYYAAVIPEKYPIVEPIMIFFPSGDKLKGIEQLEKAAIDGKYSRIESRYFLMTLYYRYEKNYTQALKYAALLRNEFPDNPTFHRYYGRIYVGLGDYKNAAAIFTDIRRKCDVFPGYSNWTRREADYYIAMNFKNLGQLDSALVYFNECEKLSRSIDKSGESGFMVNAVYYQGTIYEKMGKLEEAIIKFEQVLDIDEYQSSHDKAEQHLESIEAKFKR